MVKIAEMTDKGMLKLPADVAEFFHASDRFVVRIEGDTLHLKRMTRMTHIVDEAPEGEPISLDEINEIVHEVRRQQR